MILTFLIFNSTLTLNFFIVIIICIFSISFELKKIYIEISKLLLYEHFVIYLTLKDFHTKSIKYSLLKNKLLLKLDLYVI